MLTKTSAAKPDPADNTTAKINAVNLLHMILPSFPTLFLRKHLRS